MLMKKKDDDNIEIKATVIARLNPDMSGDISHSEETKIEINKEHKKV